MCNITNNTCNVEIILYKFTYSCVINTFFSINNNILTLYSNKNLYKNVIKNEIFISFVLKFKCIKVIKIEETSVLKLIGIS